MPMTRGSITLHEAMTADELSNVQSDHYSMDDFFRRSLGKLTLDQKRQVAELVESLIAKED